MKNTSTYFIQMFITLALIGVSISSFAQNKLKTTLLNIEALENHQTEKVNLQLDRSIFAQGENLWFKAYLLEGTYHTLTSSTNFKVNSNTISKH